jgi:hypothetical protein
MTKRFLTVAALAALVLACSPQMFAAVDEQLTIVVGAVTATVQVSTGGVLSISCVGGTSAQCGDFDPGSALTVNNFTIIGQDGGVITASHAGGLASQDQSLSVSNMTFMGYNITDTATGWAGSTNPTLQTFNQVDAQGGAGLVHAEFTDINYNTPGTPLSSTFNAAESETTDSQISTSTVQFTVLDDATNAIPAATPLYTNTLMGASNSNGTGGVNFANPNTTGSVSISTDTVLNFTGVGKIQANTTVSNVLVPEPAGIVLLGTMVLGLTGFIRKKQVKRP